MNFIKLLRNRFVDAFTDLTIKVRYGEANWKETCEWYTIISATVSLVFSAFSMAVYYLLFSLGYYETV